MANQRAYAELHAQSRAQGIRNVNFVRRYAWDNAPTGWFMQSGGQEYPLGQTLVEAKRTLENLAIKDYGRVYERPGNIAPPVTEGKNPDHKRRRGSKKHGTATQQ